MIIQSSLKGKLTARKVQGSLSDLALPRPMSHLYSTLVLPTAQLLRVGSFCSDYNVNAAIATLALPVSLRSITSTLLFYQDSHCKR